MTESQRAKVLTISPDCIDDALVERAAAALRAGRLVAIPTETVYGLGCDAMNEDAIARVFAAKGRPSSDPLIVHIDGLPMLADVIEGPLPASAEALAKAFWPGPLTMVLRRNASVPAAISSGLPTVAVRCPSHPVAAAIIRAAGTPIAAPSANRFGHISPTSAQHVLVELSDRIDLVVDSGRTDRGLESTVVAIDDSGVTVLRHGAITVEQLRTHVAVRDLPTANTSESMSSPGHDKRHYSPDSPSLALAAGALLGADAAARADLNADGVVYVGFDDRVPALPNDWAFESFGSLASLDGVAHDLYDTLRRIDGLGARLIVLELSGEPGLGRAIDDRLTRAASSLVAATPEALAESINRSLISPPV